MTPTTTAGAATLAHQAAIDRFCMNLLTGAPRREGVREEYHRTLRIERDLADTPEQESRA